MAKPLTIADKCLTLLVAVLVIMNIILACSIGLILPRHITKDGWIYIDDIEKASNESLRISCTCSRIHTEGNRIHEGNGTSGKQEDQGSNRKLECMMNGTGFKCFNPLSRNESHNISIETLPNRDEIKFEPQDYNEIEKSIRMTSLKEEMKGESTHDVLRNNTDLSKSAKDLLVNNSSISSITTSYPTDKPLISKRLYSSTLSEKEATSSNIVVVSRESVEIPETSIEEYSYERLAQGTTRHTTDQTMNMMKIIPDELTEEYTQHAQRMTAQRELMSRVVHRSYINSSESSKDLLVNNSGISSMTASYQTAKSPILMRLHQSTLAVKVNTFPDNVMVSKGTVGRENHSHMRVLQETTHHMTDEVNDLQTKISGKSTGATQHTEQITVQENPMNKAVRIPASGRSSGIDNSSFTELPSNLEDNG